MYARQSVLAFSVFYSRFISFTKSPLSARASWPKRFNYNYLFILILSDFLRFLDWDFGTFSHKMDILAAFIMSNWIRRELGDSSFRQLILSQISLLMRGIWIRCTGLHRFEQIIFLLSLMDSYFNNSFKGFFRISNFILLLVFDCYL